MHMCVCVSVGVAYLNNATYKHVITLVVNSVLQHHFVHHGDENLVLKIRGQVNKRVSKRFMWFSLATPFPHTIYCPALVSNHHERHIKRPPRVCCQTCECGCEGGSKNTRWIEG